MQRDYEWLLVLLIAIGLLSTAIIMRDELFPNYIVFWSIRIIVIIIIIAIIALYRRKKLKNL